MLNRYNRDFLHLVQKRIAILDEPFMTVQQEAL